MSQHIQWRRPALLALFFASGVSGLLYEVVWTRALTLRFGASAPSLAAVLSAYMAGLAIGSAGIARLAARVRRPLRLYGLLELGVGLAAVGVPAVLPLADPLLRALYDGDGGPGAAFVLVRFAIAFVALLPPTVLMGATLPLLADALATERAHAGLHAGQAYAVNTLGAMTGAYLAGFELIRLLGMRQTWWLAIAINVVVGAAAVALGRRESRAPEPTPEPVGTATVAGGDGDGDRQARWVIALCGYAGFASLAYEVLWTRYFVNTFHSTVAAFSTILIAYLGGLGFGALAASGLTRRQAVTLRHLTTLQAAVALLAVLLLGTLVGLPHWYIALSAHLGTADSVRVVLIAGVMLVPTFLMGMVLPLGVHLLRQRPGAVARMVGQVNAASAVGSALGPLVAAFIALPLLGLQAAVAAVAGGQVLLAVLADRAGRAPGRPRLLLGLGGAAVLFGARFLATHAAEAGRVVPVPMAFTGTAAEHQVLLYEESAHGTAMVVEHRESHERTLFIDGFAATSNDAGTAYMRLMGHLPMLMHPAPRRALVICLGTGITLGSVALHGLPALDCAEINPEVPRCARLFEAENHRVLDRPGTQVVLDDGRNYLRMTGHRYDVITLEPLPPYFSGTVSLYSREFNALAKARLTEGGVFAQWLPFHLVTDRDARMIVRAVSEVFPHVVVWKLPRDLSGIILASDRPLRFDPAALAARPAVQADLAALGFADAAGLERDVVLPEEKLAAYVDGAPPVTDDRPTLEYRDPSERFPVGSRALARHNIDALRAAAGLPPEPP